MNVITLTGNAVKDVELKYTPNGKAVGGGTIAVRRDFKNPQGEYETDFINFVALGKSGELMANHIKKGDKFGITGRLQIRKWEKDNGEKQYFTEVIVNSFDFPNKPKESQQQNNKPADDPFSGSQSFNPDELPF